MHTIERRMSDYQLLLNGMAHSVLDSLDNAFVALVSLDKDLALRVMEDDEKINATEASIHNQAIEILTLLQPLAKDLRLLIGGIRIANDLERIGDYAKNIARYVVRTGALEPVLMERFLVLKELLMNNVRKTFELLEDRSIKRAYDLALRDDDLDVIFKSLLVQVVDLKVDHIVELTGMLRNVERAGDHAKNICEIVIYIENGEFIDFG